MTTLIEEKQLGEELKELAVIAEEWVTKLVFLEKDLLEIQKMCERAETATEEISDVACLTQRLLQINGEVRELSDKHLTAIKKLKYSDDYSLTLIEEHVMLEVEIKDMLCSYKSLRKLAKGAFRDRFLQQF